MSLDVSAAQGAFINWVQSVLALPEANLLWANQAAPEPTSGAWVSLRLLDVSPVAEVDTSRAVYVGGAELGEEVEVVTEGLRSLTFSIQAFSRGVVAGNSSALALLSRLLMATRLESARAAFLAGGLSLYRRGAVTDLSALNAQRFEGRALLELFFYAVDSASEATGYISSVQGNLTAGEVVPFTADVPTP